MKVSDFPPMEFSQIVLDRIKLGAVSRISPAILAHTKVEMALEHETGAMLLRLNSEILGKQRNAGEYVLIEDWEYDSWRDHLIASLPEGSFRRRWCQFFFKIDEVGMKRATHRISVNAAALFPELDVQYPDNFGKVVFPVQFNDNRSYFDH